MSNSVVVEWLNENEQRAYPLSSNSNRYLLKGKKSYDLYRLIVDALLVFPSNSPDLVSLFSIQLSSGNMIINVTGQSTFVINDYLNAAYPVYVRNDENSLIVVSDYAKELPNNTKLNLDNVQFEYSVIYELTPSLKGVNSLTFNGIEYTGEIVLNEGYQVSLVPSGNSIKIEAGRSEGIPLPCISVKEVAEDCADVVSMINGATPDKTGNIVKFVGDNHVVVFDDPDNNRIYIGYDFTSEEIPVQQLVKPKPII